jgi:hypothetical protein
LTQESEHCKKDGCTCGHCECRTKDQMSPTEIRKRNIETLRWCDGRILGFYREMDPLRLTLSTVDESLGGKDFTRVYEALHGVHTAINRHLDDLCGETSKGLDFGDVVRMMKADPSRRFRRKGWNGRGIYIQLLVPGGQDRMTHPYIYIDTTGLQSDNPDAPRDLVPWLASQTDMLAEDWEEVKS